MLKTSARVANYQVPNALSVGFHKVSGKYDRSKQLHKGGMVLNAGLGQAVHFRQALVDRLLTVEKEHAATAELVHQSERVAPADLISNPGTACNK